MQLSMQVYASYLAPFPKYGGLLVQWLLSTWHGWLSLTHSFGENP